MDFIPTLTSLTLIYLWILFHPSFQGISSTYWHYNIFILGLREKLNPTNHEKFTRCLETEEAQIKRKPALSPFTLAALPKGWTTTQEHQLQKWKNYHPFYQQQQKSHLAFRAWLDTSHPFITVPITLFTLYEYMYMHFQISGARILL